MRTVRSDEFLEVLDGTTPCQIRVKERRNASSLLPKVDFTGAGAAFSEVCTWRRCAIEIGILMVVF